MTGGIAWATASRTGVVQMICLFFFSTLLPAWHWGAGVRGKELRCGKTSLCYGAQVYKPVAWGRRLSRGVSDQVAAFGAKLDASSPTAYICWLCSAELIIVGLLNHVDGEMKTVHLVRAGTFVLRESFDKVAQCKG